MKTFPQSSKSFKALMVFFDVPGPPIAGAGAAEAVRGAGSLGRGCRSLGGDIPVRAKAHDAPPAGQRANGERTAEERRT